jgi:hypothetical protein
MSANITSSGAYKLVSGTGNVCPRTCNLLGFMCNSTTSGTINIYDDASTGTSTPVTGTITPNAGQWYPLPVSLSQGLNVVIANTLNVTMVFI